MALRHYICQIIGDGASIETAFHSVLADLLPGTPTNSVDCRTDSTLTSGQMLTSADVTEAQHATVIADPRVRAVPFEDLAGLPLLLDTTLDQIPLTKRIALRDRLEAEHIPTHDLTLSHTVRDVLKRVIRRCVLRQLLKNLDYAEGLDTLISAISTARRNSIRNRLQELGFDTSVIALTDTIREALRKLHSQAVRWTRTHFD